jgi:hypothetical protein
MPNAQASKAIAVEVFNLAFAGMRQREEQELRCNRNVRAPKYASVIDCRFLEIARI